MAAESGLAEAVRAVNNLATAQVRKETPSLIDVNGLGRPKEFSGREEDFQQWSKKTEAFFAGVIIESEMMFEWAAEQPKDHDDGDWSRVLADTEECKTWGFRCSRCTPPSWLSRVMKRMKLSPTRGRIHWRHGGDYRRDTIRQHEEENETFCARSLLLDLQARIERLESHVSRYKKKMEDKLGDEIKLAGFEVIGARGSGETSDPQLESLANVRGRAPGSRDVRRGEVCSENSWFQAKRHGCTGTVGSHGC